MVDLYIPDKLLETTFCVEYSPNCYKKWLVRLVGPKGVIDKLPYAPPCTQDILGFGDSFDEAASQALVLAEEARQARMAKIFNRIRPQPETHDAQETVGNGVAEPPIRRGDDRCGVGLEDSQNQETQRLKVRTANTSVSHVVAQMPRRQRVLVVRSTHYDVQ